MPNKKPAALPRSVRDALATLSPYELDALIAAALEQKAILRRRASVQAVRRGVMMRIASSGYSIDEVFPELAPRSS